jgi:DNA polymerase (family 10)
MNNLIVSSIFDDIMNLLKIKGANSYKIRAYERASKLIRDLEVDVAQLIKEGRLTEISGIGESLAENIKEIVETGSCEDYNLLINEYPATLISLLKVSGVGASKVRQFYNELGIKDLNDLKEKAEVGVLSQLSGIGPKTENKILESIDKLLSEKDKFNLGEATHLANQLKDYIEAFKEVDNVKVTGAVRRKEEVIDQIDLVIATDNFNKTVERLEKISIISNIDKLAHQTLVVDTKLGIKIKISVTDNRSFWEEVFWSTASKEYSQRLQEIIDDKGKDTSIDDFKDEQEMFKSLNLPYIIPELRDDLESIDRAQNHKLPNSIELKDIKGDLHMHSRWSDGRYTIKEMARACQQKGYKYMGICDHTQSLTVANGLSPDRLKSQWEEIDKLNESLDITILKGAEVDILAEGLDYSDDILAQLDIVIASIHSGFNNSREKMMDRIIRALEHPHVHILAHPTGRIVLGRGAYNIDFERLIHKAIETNTILEINASPKRLDLNYQQVKLAHQLGAKFIINTDAHKTKDLDNMGIGISVARKGWLEKDDVVNTLELSEFKELLAR